MTSWRALSRSQRRFSALDSAAQVTRTCVLGLGHELHVIRPLAQRHVAGRARMTGSHDMVRSAAQTEPAQQRGSPGLVVRSFRRRVRQKYALGRHRPYLGSSRGARLGVVHPASHQWTRLLPWISLMGLCFVLAWVMNIAVTSGFVDHQVVLPTPAVVSNSVDETLICESVTMGVDARCYERQPLNEFDTHPLGGAAKG